MTPDTKRILLTGGGSGGHVYPLLAVAESLWDLAREKNIVLDIKYIGPKDAYAELLRARNIGTTSVPAGKIRRYLSPLTLLDIPKVFFGVLAALWKLFWLMPDVIFSKGGTGALPVVVAGWFYRIPILIHESDAAPGLNNLLSAPFASRIAVTFQRAMKYFRPKKTAWVGTPLRKELFAGRPPKEEAKEALGFDKNAPLTLILGGSQGSERINKFVLTILQDFLRETQVFHQTGTANFKEVEKLSRAALADLPKEVAEKTRYEVAPYLEDNLKTALVAADLIVARAGSGTISEISAFGKPAILIPLFEAANDHQRVNAYEFAKGGGAVIIEEPNLLPAIFMAQLKSILKNQETMNKMASASEKFSNPGAAEVLAQELLKMAG